MSKVVGKLLTCDRCGTTEFLPFIGREKLDDGHTHVDNFEAPKEPWSSKDIGKIEGKYIFVDLCPACSKDFSNITINFMKKGS